MDNFQFTANAPTPAPTAYSTSTTNNSQYVSAAIYLRHVECLSDDNRETPSIFLKNNDIIDSV